jgi:hypothetical protein
MIKTLNNPKHIAMWSCPRSRSTAIAHAFEQRTDCLVIDEPFYAAFLLNHGKDYPHREATIKSCETDYHKIIQQITGALPAGITFSFQKHIARQAVPEFGTDWLPALTHFFLLRDPKEIIMSWYNVTGHVTMNDVGIIDLYRIFKLVHSTTSTAPIALVANDLLKNPAQILSRLCAYLEIPFSEKMLHWEPGLKDSNLVFTGSLSPLVSTWYSAVADSQGFFPYNPKPIELPSKLIPLLESCQPYYEKLMQNCHLIKV